MLTSFFGKSSPLNFLLVSTYILIIGGLHYVFTGDNNFTTFEISVLLGATALLIFSMLLLDFTIRKNSLTLLNTFGIFLFSCSTAMLPELFSQPAIIFSNLCLLLAFRRMFSLQSSKNTEIKILDASIWIGVASIFYFWSIFLILVLYTALFFVPQRSLRYFLIPPIGGLGLFLIATAYQLLVNDSFDWIMIWPEKVSFDFSAYATWELIVFITFMLVLTVWTIFPKIADLTKGPRKEKPNKLLQLYAVGICILIASVSANKTGAELVFIVPPSVIIISGYIEKKSDVWFKEILLWCFLLLPIAFLIV